MSVIICTELSSSNAPLPIEITVFGMKMLLNLLQYAKAQLPMLVTVEGTMYAPIVQPLKALSPMTFTVLEISQCRNIVA